jgi:hypothetical protein
MVASKISETILDFARPILDLVGGSPTEDQVRQALQLAVTDWNAVILDESVASTDYVQRARSLLHGKPGHLGLFDDLVCRKRTVFAADRRLVGDVQVLSNPKGEARVRITAHAPPPKRKRGRQSDAL